MTFGKRLLRHLYTYKFFANCHTRTYPLGWRSIRRKDIKQIQINKQQKMPHRPFYSTSLRCVRTPMLLTMDWKAKSHVVGLLQCPHTIWGAMYRFVLSLSPIYASVKNLLWSLTPLLLVYIYWQGVIIRHKWKSVNTFDDQNWGLVNI